MHVGHVSILEAQVGSAVVLAVCEAGLVPGNAVIGDCLVVHTVGRRVRGLEARSVAAVVEAPGAHILVEVSNSLAADNKARGPVQV